MGIFNVFGQAKKVWNQASLVQEEVRKIEKLASSKNLREAVTLSEKIISDWSNVSWGQELARQFMLGETLEQLKSQSKSWKSTIHQVNKWANEAQGLEESDSGNPFEIDTISHALTLYQQCLWRVNDPAFSTAIQRIQKKLHWRQNFKSLLSQGQESTQQGYYKQALSYLLEAKKLFNLPKLEKAIALCEKKIPEEKQYETKLFQAQNLAKEGDFKQAFLQFKPAYAQYRRLDGKEFLKQLQRVLKGKQLYLEGLRAEKTNDLVTAFKNYEESYNLLPEVIESKIRLSIVKIKQKNWQDALWELEGLHEDKATYLRGFVYAKLGQLQQADREWRSISHSNIQAQREILKSLVQRDRVQIMQTIEQFVNAGNIESAKSASLDFIQKYGINSTVEFNLYSHIQPRLDNAIWKSQNWQDIASEMKKDFIEKQDIVSLHNWAVASYYLAQVDSTKIRDCIPAWLTALVNLSFDPSLQDISWLNDTLDLEALSIKLMQQLENAIDAVKDVDLNEYFRLRDRYRLDKIAIGLFKASSNEIVKLKSIAILPNCYQHYRSHFADLETVTFPAEIWGTLYTQWGEAVAACLEGDITRGISIQPQTHPMTSAEKFGKTILSYSEGCYHLQNKQWREAVSPLQIAKYHIKSSQEWQEKIDHLCQQQRQEIKKEPLKENLNFAQFWYDLLGSSASKSYLVEYKTEEIREKIVNKKVDLFTALNELNSIQKIDPKNPVVLDLINGVEFVQEAEDIDQLMSNNDFEEAVKRAKRSRQPRTRYMVAEVCINILLEGAETRQLSGEAIYKLGRWAYELCPNEPNFQPIYNQLRIPY